MSIGTVFIKRHLRNIVMVMTGTKGNLGGRGLRASI